MALNQIAVFRREFLNRVAVEILNIDNNGFVNIADKNNKTSRDIAFKLSQMIGGARCPQKVSGQTAGTHFTNEVKLFLEKSFSSIPHLLSAPLKIATETEIYHFAQYEHLSKLTNIMKEIVELKTIIGTDYLVKPDVVIYRQTLTDEEIGYTKGQAVPKVASLTPIRKSNFEILGKFCCIIFLDQ